jgi:hypothetical protein
MAVVDQLLRLYAQSIFAKAGALKALALTPNQRKRLCETITAEIRACGGLLYPEVRVPEVSKAALQEADRIGVNLRAQTWRSQPSFDRGRKAFHWEHVNPIACIQEACEAAESEEAILDALARLRVAWILKREDQELTGRRFRSKRPDPEGAYQEAGIVLVKQEQTEQPASADVGGITALQTQRHPCPQRR